MTYVGRFPDEIQHVSYIAYLEKYNVVIPEFKNMTVLEKSSDGKNTASIAYKMGYGGTFRFSAGFNYLGHPPLYYHIMRLSGGVKVKNGVVTVDIFRLRSFNILLAAISLLLMFYIGYTRLGNVPAVHLLYAAVCVSVPMLAYDCAGVNNDTLALLGIAVFMLGQLRLSEKKYSAKTWAILGAGIAVTLLSKLVAGLAVALAIIVYVVFLLKREKNLDGMFSKAMLAAVPFCAVAFIYFILIHLQTGSFQPTFRKLSPAQFYASNFYIRTGSRMHFNLIQYAGYYWNAFMHTWTGIYSYVALQKTGSFFSLSQIGLAAVWLLPIMLFIQVRKKYHYPMAMALVSMYVGLLLTVVIQFFRAFYEFKMVSGYLGGYQSRYYLCMIPMLALAAVYAFGFLYDSNTAIFRTREDGQSILLSGRQWAVRRKFVVALCIILSALLFYEDFAYFLINFKDYI